MTTESRPERVNAVSIPSEQAVSGGIGCGDGGDVLADIDRNDDRGWCDWGIAYRHGRTSGGVPSIGWRGNVPDPRRKWLMFTSFVTPPEVFVKGYSDLYQCSGSLSAGSVDARYRLTRHP